MAIYHVYCMVRDTFHIVRAVGDLTAKAIEAAENAGSKAEAKKKEKENLSMENSKKKKK